jgi:hypothetical protein
VRLGKAPWIVDGPTPGWVRRARRRATLDGSVTVSVAVDGQPAGVLLLTDPLVLVTGDRADISLMSANANTAARSESHNVVAR